MANIDISVVVRAVDQASSVMKGVGASFERAGDSFKKTVEDARAGAAVITGSMLLISKSILKVASDMEQSKVSFDVMLGSADESTRLLSKISDFAKKTPFDLPQVVEGTKRLLAYNIEAKNIIPTFEMLGNIASGVGRDKLNQLILAFGQVKAATKLTGMELRQFSEAGVPLLQALVDEANKTGGALVTVGGKAKKTKADIGELNWQLGQAKLKFKEATDSGKAKESTLNALQHSITKYEGKLAEANTTQGTFTKRVKVTTEQMKDMISEGKVSFDQVNRALMGMTVEGGKFFELMDRQSKTFSGMMSNIRDQLVRVAYAFVGLGTDAYNFGQIVEGGLYQKLTQATGSVLNNLNSLEVGVARFMGAFMESRTAIITTLGIIAGLFAPLIVSVGALILPAIQAGLAFGAIALAISQLLNAKDLLLSKNALVEQSNVQLEQSLNRVKQATDNLKMSEDILTDSKLNLERANLQVEKAQDFYDKTLKRYGPTAVQTRDAELNLKMARREVEKATQDVEKATTSNQKALDEYGVAEKKYEAQSKRHVAVLEDERSVWQRIADAIGDAIRKFGEYVSKTSQFSKPGVSLIPHLQTGGMVPGPIGQPVPAILHGGEEVIPAERVSKGSGGGGGIVFEVNIGMYAGSETEKRNIAEELYRGLVRVAQSQNMTVAEAFGG